MIKIQSPTRVDLAGGTLDCWPLYLFVGDCVTVNLSIDVWTGCELVLQTASSIDISVQDLNYQRSFTDLQDLLACKDKELILVRAVIDYFQPRMGFSLKTFSQSPVGGGLGGSSSLCISLIKAFLKLANKTLSTSEIVNLAHNLEAKVILNPTGTQDYFPAIEPGLNVIHYTARGPELERLDVSLEEIAKGMLLIYTGRSHHSGINNWQVIKAVIEGDTNVLATLKEIARISAATAQACREQRWGDLPELFRHEYDSRIKLTASFSSPETELLKTTVMNEGATAVKICGAGGGGCVLVWAESNKHERIREACRKNGFQPIDIRPVTGSVAR